MLLVPYERFAEWVLERSKRRVGNKHSDAVTMYRTIHIPLAIALYYLLSPRAVVSLIPFEILERSHSTMVFPVDHVGRSIEKPILHDEALGVVLIMSGIKINGVSMHIGSGVCRITGLNDGHIELLSLRHSEGSKG